MDMNHFWECLDKKESSRVLSLEMFDEEEEWKIKCAHYFIVHATKGKNLNSKDALIQTEIEMLEESGSKKGFKK